MCERCDGSTDAPHPDRARVVYTRRAVLAVGASVAAGFALSLLNCQQPNTPSPATAASKAASGGAPLPLATEAAKTQAALEAPEATATETAPATNAATTPATRPLAELGSEVFPDANGYPLAAATDAPVILIPRTDWTTARPDLAHIDRMNGVSKVTVHHTAGEIQTDAWRPTANELENIREYHAGTRPGDRQWADIAYHFAVDRAGRVWQARPLAYQGAHARGNNEHNLGIVLLGNFEVQSPSAAQLTSLASFIAFVRDLYRIPVEQVFTHGELVDTSCPGKVLLDFMTRTRVAWAGREGTTWKPSTQPLTPPEPLPKTARSKGH